MSNDNIRRGLGDADQARRDRIERADRREPRERSTFGADAATLSAWLEDDPSLYSDLSLAQRIGLGFHERELERHSDISTEGDQK